MDWRGLGPSGWHVSNFFYQPTWKRSWTRRCRRWTRQLGEVICLPDPAAAAQRDQAMQADLAAGVEQPPRPLPRLGPGLHRDNAGGLLSIQAEVRGCARRGLFDDVVGTGGVLLLIDPRLRDGLGPRRASLLADLGWRIVGLATEPGQAQVVDNTGAYAAWFAALGAVAVLIRPDLYLYGCATDAGDLAALLDHLGAALRTPAPMKPSSSTAGG